MTKKSRKRRRRSRRGGQNIPLEIRLDPLRQRAHIDLTSVSNPKMQHAVIDKKTMEEMRPNDSAFNKWADWGCPSKDYSDQGSKGFCWMISTMILLLNLKIPLNQKVNSFLEKLENQFNSGKLEENCAIYPRWLKKWYDPGLTAQREGGLTSHFVRALLRASGYFVFYGVKSWSLREGHVGDCGGISTYYKNPPPSCGDFCGDKYSKWQTFRLPSIAIASTPTSILEDMSNNRRPDLAAEVAEYGLDEGAEVELMAVDENLKNMMCWEQGEDWLKRRKGRAKYCALRSRVDADKYTIFMIEYASAVYRVRGGFSRARDDRGPYWNIKETNKIDIHDFKEFLQNAPEKVRGGAISCRPELYSFKMDKEMNGRERKDWALWSDAVIQSIKEKDKEFFKNNRVYQIIQKKRREWGDGQWTLVKQGSGAWVKYLEDFEKNRGGKFQLIDKGHNYTKGPWEIEWQPRGPVPRVRHKLSGTFIAKWRMPDTTTTMAEAKSVSGKWWSVVIKHVHADGFFDVEVQDGEGTQWSRMPPHNVRDGRGKCGNEGWPNGNLDLDERTLQTNTSGHAIPFFKCGNAIFYCNSWGNPCNDIDQVFQEYDSRPNRWIIMSFYILIFQPPTLALQLGWENEAAKLVLMAAKSERRTRKKRLQPAAQRRGLYTWGAAAEALAKREGRLLRPRGRGRVAHGLGDIGSLPFSPQTLGMTKVLAERHVRYPVGKLVEAQVGREWYPARVTKISGGKYTVQYEDDNDILKLNQLFSKRMENQLRGREARERRPRPPLVVDAPLDVDERLRGRRKRTRRKRR